MGVATTSKTAYDRIKDLLGDRQLEVYEAIGDLGVATNEAIADYLNWPINRVTGRVTELKRYGLVDVEGMGRNKTGFTAKLWGVRSISDKKLLEMSRDCEA